MALNKIISEGIKDGEVKNADIATGSVDINDINTSSGTAADDTYLRGDGKWMTPPNTTVGGGTGVSFNDNVAANWGAGNDLVLKSDGTNGLVTGNTQLSLGYTSATNQIQLDSNGVRLVANTRLDNSNHLTVRDSSEVRFTEATANGDAYVGIKSPTDKGSDASYTITLPSAAPTANGQSLTATTAGVASWSTPAAGATGGGTDKVFWVNDNSIDEDYTIPDGKNAGTFGPVTIAAGKTVEIGDGEYWTII